MEQEYITLTYEGDKFEYQIDKSIQCEHCGYTWETTSEMTRPTCPNCNRKTDRDYVYSYHFYIKMAWWFNDPGPDVQEHGESLRRAAKRLEALAAHGWDVVHADGEHLYFERETLNDLQN